MRAIRVYLLCCLTLLCTCVRAQIADTVNTIFPEGTRIESKNFTGPVWVERILKVGEGTDAVAVGNVTFPPKSRSNWHSHNAGQSLLVLDGVGYYQQRGEPVRVVRKGESIQCPGGVEHWHGAANDAWFVQLAMTQEHPDGRVTWGEPVTDIQYRAGLVAEELSLRYYHLARVAGLTTRGETDELPLALRAALDAGLNVAELREALVHLYAYAGFPRSIQGLKVLLGVAQAHEESGAAAGARVVVGEGSRNVSQAKERGNDRYAEGLATLEALTGRSWASPSDYGKFAPRIDVFLKEHLFADVFADETLSYADREVVTVAVLAVLGEGVEPMLNGHSGIARRQGVSEGDLKMVVKTATD